MKKFIISAVISIAAVSLLSSCYNSGPVPKLKEYDDEKVVEDILNYDFEVLRLYSLQSLNETLEQNKDVCLCYQDSLNNIVSHREVVYVKRIASSSVMNNPAFYNKNYSGNVITENGGGAENEDFVLIYLSDGKIIKASTKQNPQWMGVLVDEKVIKTTGRKIKSTYKTVWYCSLKTQWSNWMLGKFYCDEDVLNIAEKINYADYVTYQPLYQK